MSSVASCSCLSLTKEVAALRSSAVQRRKQGRATKLVTAKKQQVDYGEDWYSSTKNFGRTNTIKNSKKYMDNYREANRLANNGKERKDLYTDNWDGDVYKGRLPSNCDMLVLLIASLQMHGNAGCTTAWWGLRARCPQGILEKHDGVRLTSPKCNFGHCCSVSTWRFACGRAVDGEIDCWS